MSGLNINAKEFKPSSQLSNQIKLNIREKLYNDYEYKNIMKEIKICKFDGICKNFYCNFNHIRGQRELCKYQEKCNMGKNNCIFIHY
jgi:hypothetical protein